MSLVERVKSWIPEKTPELEMAVEKLPEYLFKIKGRYYSPPIITERKTSGKIIISIQKGYDLPEEMTLPICASNVIWKRGGVDFTYLGINYELVTKKPKES